MQKKKFNIPSAVKNAYVFVGNEGGFLIRLALAPFIIYIINMLAVQQYATNAGLIENFLWGLPSEFALAWYMFAETRLILLGERQHPATKKDRMQRKGAMQSSVIILVLFKMVLAAIMAYMYWVSTSETAKDNAFLNISFLFLIGALFWGLRFSVAHILAAVGYPIRAFLTRVHGLLFSLQLTGMGLLCITPVYFAMFMLMSFLLPGQDAPLTQDQINSLIIFTSPFIFLSATLLNAAAAYALKDMLGRPPKGVSV